MTTIYDFSAVDLDGNQRSLAEFSGRLLLVVNVASRCGFTPQYAGLEKLWRDLGERGVTVLGFPCDQFGHQEPGDEAEIREFCSVNYDVTFPMFAKIDVNGGNAHPLYRWLRKQRPGLFGTDAIKWNFTKFLVDSDGTALKRYAPKDPPARIQEDVEALLKASA